MTDTPPIGSARPAPAARGPALANWRDCDGFVFVVTYGRSGSTVLLNLLNSIDGYCLRGENNNALLHVYRAWAALAQSPNLRFHRNRGTATSPAHPWYGGELTRPWILREEMVRGFCNAVLAIPKGTRVAGFKEIRHPRDPETFRGFMEFHLAAFPNSRIVFNTRDHAQVARSGWFADKPEAAVRQSLGQSDRLFDDFARTHPKRCFALRYDDWAGRPEALRPLFDFLGEPFDAARVAAVLDTKLTHMK